MRWNCPHCQTELTAIKAVKKEWSFAQCFHCQSYALVKLGESQGIKVLEAPPGEAILETRAIVPPRLTTLEVSPPLSVTLTVPERRPSAGRIKLLPLLTGAASTVALASGAFLYVQSQDLFERLRQQQVASPAVDHLHQVANAPDRTGDRQAAAAEDAEPASAPIPSTLAPSGGEGAFAVKPEAATSCVIKAVDFKSAETSMLLRVKGSSAKLRSGPGLEFPVLLTAGPELVLEAYDWDGRWFKVRAKSVKAPESGVRAPASVGSTTGFVWIRNDLVERLTDRQ